MLRELAANPTWRAAQALPQGERQDISPRQNSIYDTWPELAKAYPRLPHLEIIFDATCDEVAARSSIGELDIPRIVGLWMAAETQAEINLRHLEDGMGGQGPPLPSRSAPLDPDLFAATVDRLMALRPGLSRAEAGTAVEALVGARRLEAEPLFMPAAWERELELQQARLSSRA
jgi:hypothetical protein